MSDTINPWTIGVARLGNGPAVPADHPLHRLTVTRLSVDEHDDRFNTAEQAVAERVQRLKESGTKCTVSAHVGGQSITYTEPVSGDLITLTYTDTENQT
jgi:hypothetical protein